MSVHYGPEWFWDQTRPGAIQARKEMEEFHRSFSAAQAIQVAQEAIMISSDYKTHLFTYRHDGAEWTLEIKARDIHDAKERLKALSLARYDGELITKLMARSDDPYARRKRLSGIFFWL